MKLIRVINSNNKSRENKKKKLFKTEKINSRQFFFRNSNKNKIKEKFKKNIKKKMAAILKNISRSFSTVKKKGFLEIGKLVADLKKKKTNLS